MAKQNKGNLHIVLAILVPLIAVFTIILLAGWSERTALLAPTQSKTQPATQPGTITPACNCGEQCNKGSSPKVRIGTSGFETEVPKMFEQMEAKKKELQQFLDNAKCSDGCTGTKSGPTLTMHIEPASPGAACQTPSSTTFTIGPITDYSCRTDSSNPNRACEKAKSDLRDKLLAEVQSKINGPDPCPECSYYIKIEDLKIGECYAKDSGACRYVDGSLKLTLTCGPKRTSAEWDIWYDWNACLCCSKANKVVIAQD